MRTITIPVTISVPDNFMLFGFDLIRQRLRDSVNITTASKLLDIKVIRSNRDPISMDSVIHAELTFGRWFPFQEISQYYQYGKGIS